MTEFYNNPMFAIIVATALGGVASVMSIVEFIKTTIDDSKENNPNLNDSFWVTRNGRKIIVIVAALVYTLVAWFFGGLSDDRLAGAEPLMRYIILWVALSICSMGAYDLLFNRKSKDLNKIEASTRLGDVNIIPKGDVNVTQAADVNVIKPTSDLPEAENIARKINSKIDTE